MKQKKNALAQPTNYSIGPEILESCGQNIYPRNLCPLDCFADVPTSSTEPQWFRATKATPVAALGGMAFASPPLTAETHRTWTYFFPLLIAFEGQGEEMSSCQKDFQKRDEANPTTTVSLFKR